MKSKGIWTIDEDNLLLSLKKNKNISTWIEISSFFNVTLDWICFGRELETDADFNINYKELAEARKEIIDMQRKMIQRLEQDKNDLI